MAPRAGLLLAVLLTACDEKPQVVIESVPSLPTPKPPPEAKPAAPSAPVGADSCPAAYERASAALAKRDFRAVAGSLDPSLVQRTVRDVVVPGNFGVMGHALATSGPKGSTDALAAILNRYGGMLTVDERLAGLDLEQMQEHTAGRVMPRAEAFVGELLEWADEAGYPGDPLAAITGLQNANPTVFVPVDPQKGLVGSLTEKGALPEAPKPKTGKVPASEGSLGPLLEQLAPGAKLTKLKAGTATASATVERGGKPIGTVSCVGRTEGWFLSR